VTSSRANPQNGTPLGQQWHRMQKGQMFIAVTSRHQSGPPATDAMRELAGRASATGKPKSAP
jgi:hypothetical protein